MRCRDDVPHANAHAVVLDGSACKMYAKMYGGGEARILEWRGPKPGQDGGKMYGWRGGVYILVWAYK